MGFLFLYLQFKIGPNIYFNTHTTKTPFRDLINYTSETTYDTSHIRADKINI